VTATAVAGWRLPPVEPVDRPDPVFDALYVEMQRRGWHPAVAAIEAHRYVVAQGWTP
jgi:hypothetical protein